MIFELKLDVSYNQDNKLIGSGVINTIQYFSPPAAGPILDMVCPSDDELDLNNIVALTGGSQSGAALKIKWGLGPSIIGQVAVEGLQNLWSFDETDLGFGQNKVIVGTLESSTEVYRILNQGELRQLAGEYYGMDFNTKTLCIAVTDSRLLLQVTSDCFRLLGSNGTVKLKQLDKTLSFAISLPRLNSVLICEGYKTLVLFNAETFERIHELTFDYEISSIGMTRKDQKYGAMSFWNSSQLIIFCIHESRIVQIGLHEMTSLYSKVLVRSIMVELIPGGIEVHLGTADGNLIALFAEPAEDDQTFDYFHRPIKTSIGDKPVRIFHVGTNVLACSNSCFIVQYTNGISPHHRFVFDGNQIPHAVAEVQNGRESSICRCHEA